MAHRFSDRNAGELIANQFFGDRTGAIKFRKEKEKEKYESWYNLFKEQLGGRTCVTLDGLGAEICFDNISIRQL